MISLPLENLTSCSPIISPFLNELKFIFFHMEKFFYLNIFPQYIVKIFISSTAIPLPNISAVPEG